MFMFDAYNYVDLSSVHTTPQWMNDKKYHVYDLPEKKNKNLIVRLLMSVL